MLLSGATPANVALTTNSSVQQFPSVAVDPRNPKHVVVSYMDQSLVTSGYTGIGVQVSNDGGATWQTTSITLPADVSQSAANPTTAFDAQGHVFVSFMAATFLEGLPPESNPQSSGPRSDGFTADNGIYVARSDDGGMTWNAPVAVVQNAFDGQDEVPFEMHPFLAVDTYQTLPNGQPNPYFGEDYLAWVELYPPGQFPGDPQSSGGGQLMLAVSSDSGQTWSLRLQPQVSTGIPVTVLGPNDPFFTGEAPPALSGQHDPQVAVGPEGDLYVDYYEFGDDIVIHSANDGHSFSQSDTATNTGTPFNYGPYAGGNVSVLTPGGGNQFRTLPMREVVADPTRPGTVYALDAVETYDANGALLDVGDVFFARSTDYGVTWQYNFTVGGQIAQILDDDNGGQITKGTPDDVNASQQLPQIAIDSSGDIAVIWYDTRRDPFNHLLDVYGTVSTDGGQSFSANFRLSTQSFDALAGAYTNPDGATDYNIGDRIGLAIAGGTVYASWTDTRAGNQNIEFAHFAIDALPPSEPDRFKPNSTPTTATNLGPILRRHIAKLVLVPGQDDWFQITADATGTLTIAANTGTPSIVLQMELRTADGATVLSTGNNLHDISHAGTSGQTYLVHISSLVSQAVPYSLDLESITADLGPVAYENVSGFIDPGDQACYFLNATADGAVDISLTPAAGFLGALSFQILDPSQTDSDGNLVQIASSTSADDGVQQARISVTAGQHLLVKIVGATTGDFGAFTFNIENLDVIAAGLNSGIAFPAGNGPSQFVIADVNHDSVPDLVVSDADAPTVSVLLGNGDGTFQAPREFTIGAFLPTGTNSVSQIQTYKRGLAVADLNRDGNLDIVVTNPSSGDVSVLLGNGDGTFQPQRRFDATSSPNTVAVADFNSDGIPDLAVLSTSTGFSQVAILLGRGDGTFRDELLFATTFRNTTGVDGLLPFDLNGDGWMDLLLTGGSDQLIHIYQGNGDGTFTQLPPLSGFDQGAQVAVADINDDGIPDLINLGYSDMQVTYALGNGDRTFSAPQSSKSGEVPLGFAIADFGSEDADGSFHFGVLDGHPDLIVADSGVAQTNFTGPAQIAVLPAIWDSGGFEGFDNAIPIASAISPTAVAVSDVNGDGAPDIVYLDRDGMHVIFRGSPQFLPNNTPATARKLGAVVHILEPALTILPGHQDDYYSMTVPTEHVVGAGNEVVEISGQFSATGGPGLAIQVFDASGTLLGSGEDVRVAVPQGTRLVIHVFGALGSPGNVGTGAYTLDIDVLPQAVSIEPESLLPGNGNQPAGPVTSFVITLQGDRLDATSAQNPANYHVLWLGANLAGTGRASSFSVDSVVYNPGTNVDVASGITFPTAVRQTITLLFDQPLPAGFYQIIIDSKILAAPFNQDESAQFTTPGDPAVHSIVSLNGNAIIAGSRLIATVPTPAASTNLRAFTGGTPFLTQLHDDLGTLLDAALNTSGDQPDITASLLQQLITRFEPAETSASAIPFLVLFLDPVQFDLADPEGNHLNYDLRTGDFSSRIANSFVSVTSNIEVVVIPITAGAYVLNVSDVREFSRGGGLLIDSSLQQSISMTDAIRSIFGTDKSAQFEFQLPSASGTSISPQQAPVPSPAAPVNIVATPLPPLAAPADLGDQGSTPSSPSAPPPPDAVKSSSLPRVPAITLSPEDAATAAAYKTPAADTTQPASQPAPGSSMPPATQPDAQPKASQSTSFNPAIAPRKNSATAAGKVQRASPHGTATPPNPAAPASQNSLPVSLEKTASSTSSGALAQPAYPPFPVPAYVSFPALCISMLLAFAASARRRLQRKPASHNGQPSG